MDTHDKQDQAPHCSGEMPLPLLRERWPWAELFTTAPAFRGRYLLRYPTNEDVPITGLPGLAHILPIAESGPYRCPLLVPSHEGLKQFGLLGVPPETNLGRSGLRSPGRRCIVPTGFLRWSGFLISQPGMHCCSL